MNSPREECEGHGTEYPLVLVPTALREAGRQEGEDRRGTQCDVLAGPKQGVDEAPHERRVQTILQEGEKSAKKKGLYLSSKI